jgi:hypothetical protein
LGWDGSFEAPAQRFSPNGMLVLTASDDHTARLWDAVTGLPVCPPWKNDRASPGVRFTENGRSVLILQEGSVARWPVPTPMEGTRERIRLAIEVATRHTLGRGRPREESGR